MFLPSREGKLRVMTLADQRLQEMPDWDGKIELGQPGDPLPAPPCFPCILLYVHLYFQNLFF